MIPGCLIIKFIITQNAQYRNHFHNVLCLSQAKGMDINMMDLENLKAHFWDGTYVDKSENGKNTLKQCYFNEEGIKIAIKRALGDFTDRTEKLTTESGGKSLGVEEKFKLLCNTGNTQTEGSFVKKFVDYFFKKTVAFKSQDDFDNWHHEMCEIFLKVIGPKYQGGLNYGKAQKIVNMTFKNVYCLKDPHNSEKYYHWCHMPLDSITLEWIGRIQAFIKSEEPNYLRKSRIPSWSKMNYEKEDSFKNLEGKCYYSYKEIQEAIFTYFAKYVEKNPVTEYLKECTPFQAEFFVWKYMQLEFFVEGLYNQFLSFEELDDKVQKDKKNKFKKKTINEKLEYLQNMLKDIEIYKISKESSKN